MSTETPPLLSEEQFARYVEQSLAERDGCAVRERNGVLLDLRINKSDIQVDLGPIYPLYSQNPAQIDAVVNTLAKTLLKRNEDRSTSDFASLRERVYPMLKPIALLATVREQNLPMLVYRPFLADLIITYVIDEPDTVVYINEPHLERWKIDGQQLHDQALANLNRRTAEHAKFTVTGEGAQRLFIFNTLDGFDATRLLLPDALAEWRPNFPGRMVLGIPNRDFLIAFSDADRPVLENVARQVEADAVQRDHGLTDKLFTLINNEIREYEWE